MKNIVRRVDEMMTAIRRKANCIGLFLYIENDFVHDVIEGQINMAT